MNDDKTSRNVAKQYHDITRSKGWQAMFQEIARTAFHLHTFTVAKNNTDLNRYRDVYPYDHSRVILKRSERDYINANYVEVPRAERKYILTQGPLLSTVEHFWLMIWEQKTLAIVMLNKILEKNEIKCVHYWPQGVGPKYTLQLNNVKLAVLLITEADYPSYSVRMLRIYDLESKESRCVMQYHYTAWPDFGVPNCPLKFLDFLKKVRSSGAFHSRVGPAVVHCSAGIGRSGTFCLVDSCLAIVENEGNADVNVQEILMEMRKYRMGLVQTPDQLIFSYKAIIAGAIDILPGDKSTKIIYDSVVEDPSEAVPPPPPPRADSLSKAPVRPLPAIPTSASLGNLNLSENIPENCTDNDSPLSPREISISEDSSDSEISCELSNDEAEKANMSNYSNSEGGVKRRLGTAQPEKEIVLPVKKHESERLSNMNMYIMYKYVTFAFIFAVVVYIFYYFSVTIEEMPQ